MAATGVTPSPPAGRQGGEAQSCYELVAMTASLMHETRVLGHWRIRVLVEVMLSQSEGLAVWPVLSAKSASLFFR